MPRGTLKSFLSLAFVFRPYLYKKIGQKVLIFFRIDYAWSPHRALDTRTTKHSQCRF